MPTYRQALEKLMSNPRKLKAWKKKYGDATLANFTKVSKRFSQKPVNEIKSRGIEKFKSQDPTAAVLGTKKKTKEKDKTKVEIGTGASNVLEGSGGVASKPTDKNRRKTLRNVERLKKIAKRGKNNEARLNRRADRIAARKGFEGAGEFNEDGTPNNEGLMKARGKARELMAERKQKGKDFWRNFGSQMVRGTQAPPREGFQVREGVADTAYGSMDDTPEGAEASEKLNKDSIDAKYGVTTDHTNSNMAKNLFKDYSNWGKDIIESGMEKRENPFQFTKLEEEDSTPQTAMNKIYKQKRGY